MSEGTRSLFEGGAAWLISLVGYVLALLYIPRILSRRREPGATLAWLVFIVAVPYLGIPLWLLIGNTRIQRVARRKDAVDSAYARRTAHLRHDSAEAAVARVEPGKGKQGMERLIDALGFPPATECNRIELSSWGDRSFEQMLGFIASARHHIHMEYYAYHPDATGQRVRDALTEAARRGIEVRLLYDSIGAYRLWWNRRFFDPLHGAGGQTGVCMPFLRKGNASVINLRNHRKITVVDGRRALTGGLNIADEYAGREHRLGQWRDTQILVEGPAVEPFQLTFLSDWTWATGQTIDGAQYFPPPESRGDMAVHVIPSGPDQRVAGLHRLIFSLITRARDRIYLTTPYFVPDPALSTALRTASLSGVKVVLLLPRRGNHTIVDWAGKSYYEEFLEAGVEIYEFHRGLLHAKILTVDGLWNVVGSANMDIRSFRLNFEINTLIRSESFAGELEQMFVRDITASRRVRPEDPQRWSVPRRFAHTTARVLSPVL